MFAIYVYLVFFGFGELRLDAAPLAVYIHFAAIK